MLYFTFEKFIDQRKRIVLPLERVRVLTHRLDYLSEA